MAVIDKHGLLGRIRGASLELGCGERKRHEDFIGVDLIDYECVDIVGDVFDVLERIPDGSIVNVSCFHFLEHIDDVERMIDELARVVQPGGSIEIVVPHFSNPYYYSDVTHKSFFGLYTFCYFSRTCPFRRQVPRYARKVRFDTVKVDLVFKSPRPFYVRYAMRKMAQLLFNMNTYMREFYEENLSGIIYCYEIRYVLRRL